MNTIKKLDESTINLISAGEVIERPADIVKELIENSIDSNANYIELNIKNSGLDYIEVIDNGKGISKDDLKLCLDKYTTSKISNIEDLYTIDSFGFRGEALSTIKAVSNLEITSSTNDSGIAYKIDNNKTITKTSFTKGTKVIVKDLFYNLPVRKKFLKSKSSEFTKVYNTFLNFVLLNANIKFKFTSDKKKEIYPISNQDLRYQQVFGKDILNKTIKININNELFIIKGIIGKATSYFYYPRNFVYINNRYVDFPQVNKILKEVYDDYLMVQQKPFFVLFFKFNTKTIDVNVHPKKKIVKLQNEIIILQEIKKELKKIFDSYNIKNIKENTLAEYRPIINKERFNNYNKSKALSKKNKDFINYNTTQVKATNHNLKNNFNDISYNSKQNYFTQKDLLKQQFPLELSGFKITQILGQLHKTYIVCQTKEGFLLIDQHAAAERINLEKNRTTLKLEKQKLLNKKDLSFLNEEQKEFIINKEKELNDLGFIFSREGYKLFLKTIPVVLGNTISSNFFSSIIDDLKTEPSQNFKPILNKIVKLRSCKQSIKSNQELSIPEQIQLIKDLENCKHKNICAHGRPTIISYSLKDLEKLFKRVV
jgi:DNA mismatch repair protein MutL